MLQTTWVGPEVEERIQGTTFILHSAYSRAINFVSISGAFFSVLPTCALGIPFAIEVETKKDLLSYNFAPNTPLALIQGCLYIPLQFGQIAVPLRSIQKARPHIGRQPCRMPGSNPIEKVHYDLLAALIQKQKLHSEGINIALLLAKENDCTVTVANKGTCYQTELAIRARNLGDVIHSICTRGEAANPTSMYRVIAPLIGFGPGLSPSGDDFLCGVLAALFSLLAKRPALHNTVQNKVKLIISYLQDAIIKYQHLTTDVSKAFLHSACLGYFPDCLCEMTEYIKTNQSQLAIQKAHNILCLGHSSGTDLLCGFLYCIYCTVG